MLVLTWVLNSTTVAAIQLFLLNEFVNRSRICQLKYMSDKTGYPLTLDFFHFVNRQQRCSAQIDLFGAMFEKSLGDKFSLAKRLQER